MSQRITIGALRFLKWYAPFGYRNLNFLKKEYKNSVFLFEKIKREIEMDEEKNQAILLRALLESLMKQLPVAIMEVQKAETLEQRTFANHQQLIDAMNVFKRDITEDITKSQGFLNGLVEGNLSRIRKIEERQDIILTSLSKSEARIDTLGKVGGFAAAALTLFFSYLSLRG